MVSLGPSRRQGHGGFSFAQGSDRDSVRSEDVDLLTESNHLSPVVNRAQFVPSFIPWVLGFELLLLIVFEVMIFILTHVMQVNVLGASSSPFPFLCLLHVLLWFVVIILHIYLAFEHKKLQHRGYLTFCRKIRNLRLIPPLVLCFGNAILLASAAIMDHHWAKTSFFQYHLFELLFSLEFLMIFLSLIYYIVQVIAFNRERALPDCSSFVDNNFQQNVEGEIGYSDSGWPNSILEKQADMIRYLQQHNENLSRRLLRQAQDVGS